MKKQTENSKEYNTVPNIVFSPNKISRIISITLTILIDVVIIYSAFVHKELFNAQLLKDLSQLSLTAILAIVALGISVFHSDKSLMKEGNNSDNKQKIYIRYIFSVFPLILTAILGFVIAIAFEENEHIILLYSIAMILILTKSITGTIASFVGFLNIRD